MCINLLTLDLPAIVAALTEDGDTYDLPDHDGGTLRLRITPDEDINPFDEYGCYGQVAEVRQKHDVRGADPRPDGFDGNAEKMWVGQSHRAWWQPPAHVKRTEPGFAEFRRHVRDLLEFGMVVVTVEFLDGHDAYHRPIVRHAASLGGVEPMPDAEYLAEVITDLIHDLIYEREHDA